MLKERRTLGLSAGQIYKKKKKFKALRIFFNKEWKILQTFAENILMWQ